MNAFFLPVAALTLSAALVRAQDATWPHEKSDLKQEARILSGVHASGMRWAILPNTEPPQEASIRLYVDTGSLMEEEDQQGLAHFIEHMAFNGSKNFPAGSMVEAFQRLGMGFGAHTNAHTSFRETVYKLEIPKPNDVAKKEGLDSEKLMERGLTFFRDVADGLLMPAEEIEKERGVVMSEKSMRDDAGFRTMVEGFKFGLPESLVPKRLPIGTEEVIKGAKRERFTSYYSKWYTPDRMTLVVVGDLPVEMVKKQIEAKFAGLQAAAQKVPDPDFGKVETKGLKAKLHTEMESGAVTINLDIGRPSRKLPDTAENRRAKLVRDLADAMLGRRLEILARGKDSPILAASPSNGDFLRYVESTSLEITCKPENWAQALATGERELRRVLEHGFTAAEFAEAAANALNEAKQNARTAATRKHQDLANNYVKVLAAHQVFTDPGEDLKRTEEWLKGITPADCAAAFRKDWSLDDLRIFVGGKLKLDGAEEKILAAWKKSRETKVEAPKEEAAATFAYTDFGAPGKVAQQKEVAGLKVTQVAFENGVRLNVKPTDFKKDSISVAVSFGAGQLLLPKDKPGLELFMGAVLPFSGLEKHSADDLKRVLAGKTVDAQLVISHPRISEESHTLLGSTNQEDLLLQMQLMCAHFTAPGWREDGVAQFRQGLDSMYQELQHTVEGVSESQVGPWTRGGDARFAFPTRAQLEARTMAEVKEFLAEALKTGPIEIGVVGDCDPAAVVDAVAKTFGALPARTKSRPDYAAERKLAFPGPQTKTFAFKSDIPKAEVSVFWPTTDRRKDITRSRHLSLLAAVLSDRVRIKVREELGESYSPRAGSMPSDTYEGYGQIMASMSTDPKSVAKLGPIVAELADELAKKGMSADELDRARKPILGTIDRQMRDNSYWLFTVVTPSQSQPQRLEWVRSFLSDLNTAKIGDLNALAKEYLKKDRAVIVNVTAEAGK